MANAKISELTALTSPATGDLLPIVDVSDTTDAASGTTKKITLANLKASGADVDTGTEDVKFVTPKSLADAGVYQAGGTDVAIADGGTGASTATAAFDNLAPTTTQGDIIYHNGTDNVRLAKGTATQVLAMNSGATAPEWVNPSTGKIEIDATEVTVGNTVTETTLFDVTIPGGTLSTNNGVEFKIYVSDYDQRNSESLTLRMKYAGSTIATISASAPTNNDTDLEGTISGIIVADGSTSAQKVMFSIEVYESGSEVEDDTTVGLTKIIHHVFGTATATSSSDQTLSVTAQWSAANPASTITAEFWVVKTIK